MSRVPNVLRRAYATTTREFVPGGAQDRYFAPLPSRPKPTSPSFYTGAETFYDRVAALESALNLASRQLKDAQVLPFPIDLRTELTKSNATAFKKREEIAAVVAQPRLKPTQYKKILKLLGDMHQLRVLAGYSKQYEVSDQLRDILKVFEREEEDAVVTTDAAEKSRFDEFGRTYALGKRKESAARVWVIPTKPQPAEDRVPATVDEWSNTPNPALQVPTTNILVNNIPISEYFTTPAHREKVTRPLKVAGVLGAFNIFALVRGGGASGQAGAVAHGIAKALLPHVPDVKKIMDRADLLRRDPRMVERKKTGLLKARKRRAWVKR